MSKRCSHNTILDKYNITKEHFRPGVMAASGLRDCGRVTWVSPGGMAASDWMCSVRVYVLRQQGRTPSERSETLWLWIARRPASIPLIALHIAL